MIYIKGIDIIHHSTLIKNISLIADKTDAKASILPEPTQQKKKIMLSW